MIPVTAHTRLCQGHQWFSTVKTQIHEVLHNDSTCIFTYKGNMQNYLKPYSKVRG